MANRSLFDLIVPNHKPGQACLDFADLLFKGKKLKADTLGESMPGYTRACLSAWPLYYGVPMALIYKLHRENSNVTAKLTTMAIFRNKNLPLLIQDRQKAVEVLRKNLTTTTLNQKSIPSKLDLSDLVLLLVKGGIMSPTAQHVIVRGVLAASKSGLLETQELLASWLGIEQDQVTLESFYKVGDRLADPTLSPDPTALLRSMVFVPTDAFQGLALNWKDRIIPFKESKINVIRHFSHPFNTATPFHTEYMDHPWYPRTANKAKICSEASLQDFYDLHVKYHPYAVAGVEVRCDPPVRDVTRFLFTMENRLNPKS